MRAAQLRVVIVVMVVGTAPDAARAQGKDAKNFHERPRDAGSRQDGVVLLIVINHKEPQEQQTAQDAADDLRRQIDIPKGSRDCAREEK